MKLKKVYKTLAVTHCPVCDSLPQVSHMDHNEKHTAHVHAAGLGSGDAETSETTGLAQQQRRNSRTGTGQQRTGHGAKYRNQ